MRLHLYSDLHLEFGPIELPEAVTSGHMAELVLLAGDIDVRRRAVKWAAKTFPQSVAIICGNHEAYGDSLYALISDGRKQAQAASNEHRAPIKFLEREAWELVARDGTPFRILGATLWTDFELFGRESRESAIDTALEVANDYVYGRVRDAVSSEKRRLRPQDTARYHRLTKEFLAEELSKPYQGATIVMTHHAPSAKSLAAADRSASWAPCDASHWTNSLSSINPTFGCMGMYMCPVTIRSEGQGWSRTLADIRQAT